VESSFPRRFAANPIGTELSWELPGSDPRRPPMRPGLHRSAGKFVGRIYFLNFCSDRASSLAMGGTSQTCNDDGAISLA
jgi:hypothetical protein